MEKRTVLFVDDEEAILRAIKRSFANEPYETIFADSGCEALEIFKKNQVHVIVTDLGMPEMNGMELLDKVKAKYPHATRMVLTGETHSPMMLSAINQGHIFKYIVKPWQSQNKFKTYVRQAIEYYDLHSEREMLVNFFEMWIESVNVETKETQFLKDLLVTRKKHLHDWKKKCDEIPLSTYKSESLTVSPPLFEQL